ncbi:hypothetical protein WJX74_008044 [Apatococcus lobatus]|uniref:Uncharacterized protein n=2 Tax=Apatococcus TaxID=904362 RepID=A0AAW1SSJ8_9CHLO
MPESGTLTWSQEEDDNLRRLVERHGPKKWSVIAKELKTKKSKQCRRRWKNYLDGDFKQGIWTPDEDQKLLEAHAEHGNKWTEIARIVGGRTDNAVKNRFAALSKKRSVHRRPARRHSLPAHTDMSFSQQPAPSDHEEAMLTTSPSSATPSSPRSWLRPPHYQAGRDPNSPHGPLASIGARASGFSSCSMTHEDTAQAYQNSRAGAGRPLDTYPPLPTQSSAGTARAPGIDIHISQGVLTSEEQQVAVEVNDMDIPINFVFEPIPLSLDPASTPRSSLAQHISPGPPGNSSRDGSADRTDVLRWLNSSNPWPDNELSGHAGSLGQSGLPTTASAPLTYDSGSFGLGDTPPPLGHSHRQLLRKVISIAKDTQEAVFSSPDWLSGGHDPFRATSFQDQPSVAGPPVLPPIRTKADSRRQYHIKVDARQGSIVGGSGGSAEAPSSGFTSMDVTNDGSPIVDVLISPTFSSQELSILLDALNDPSSGIDQLAEASSQMQAWESAEEQAARPPPSVAAVSPQARRNQRSPWPMG